GAQTSVLVVLILLGRLGRQVFRPAFAQAERAGDGVGHDLPTALHFLVGGALFIRSVFGSFRPGGKIGESRDLFLPGKKASAVKSDKTAADQSGRFTRD